MTRIKRIYTDFKTGEISRCNSSFAIDLEEFEIADFILFKV